MKIGKMDKVELSGLIVLFAGVILLAFTFFNAYMFLSGKLNILATKDPLQAFGEVLAPLIEALIRILYLGIMGWVGSILTIRAVQLLKKERTETSQPQQQQQQQSIKTESKQIIKQEPKPEAKETKTEAEKPTKITETEKTENPSLPAPSPAPAPTPQ